MKAHTAGQENPTTSRPWDVPPHGEAVLVAPACDRQLVAGKANEEAVDLLAEFASDEGVRELSRDVPLVCLPALRVGNDSFELGHGVPEPKRDFDKRVAGCARSRPYRVMT